MNVVWRLPSEELEARFVAEAREWGMFGLKGHRSVGGCRASIYNAMEPEGIEALAPIRQRYHELIADPGELDRLLSEGAGRAAALAEPKVIEMKRRMGLLLAS